jgi:hypothetical protein
MWGIYTFDLEAAVFTRGKTSALNLMAHKIFPVTLTTKLLFYPKREGFVKLFCKILRFCAPDVGLKQHSTANVTPVETD